MGERFRVMGETVLTTSISPFGVLSPFSPTLFIVYMHNPNQTRLQINLHLSSRDSFLSVRTGSAVWIN